VLPARGDSVFHAYSAYARGLETVGGSYYFLDEKTALGWQEDWEEPAGWPTLVRCPSLSPSLALRTLLAHNCKRRFYMS
jgi:hypothetical protein